jgi:hypothetical protein
MNTLSNIQIKQVEDIKQNIIDLTIQLDNTFKQLGEAKDTLIKFLDAEPDVNKRKEIISILENENKTPNLFITYLKILYT